VTGNIWLDSLLGLIVIVLLMTLTVLMLIYAERKVSARMQQRLGPMRVGPYGLLQTVADMVKLLTKEDLRPAGADRWTYEVAVFAIFVPTFLAFVAIPFTHDWAVAFLDLGLFYIVAVTGLSFIGLVMAGWGSDNKYALLGGIRAAAQLISYEIPMVLALLAVAMVTGTLGIREIVMFQDRVPLFVWQPLAFFIFIVAALAELERQPFDIPTAESEVVGGPFIEYSGIRWSMFMLAAYTNLFVYSLLGAMIFLGGWEWPAGTEAGLWLQILLTFAKTTFLILFFIWVRFTLPRLRICCCSATSCTAPSPSNRAACAWSRRTRRASRGHRRRRPPRRHRRRQEGREAMLGIADERAAGLALARQAEACPTVKGVFAC
jgi:NADH-quinone oxidoreductase subunit H